MKYCKFLEHYREYTAGNETPELMHLWVGLSTLAGACEKRLWIDQGYFNLYLNLYVILLAPAGVCAKSTSMDLGAKLLKDCSYTIMEGSVTKEKIIEEMISYTKAFMLADGTTFPHTPVTFISNELNVLLTSGTEMVKFLVDIFDRGESYQYKTKTAGTYDIVYPYFNLLAAAVPQWFGGSIASDMVATGFLARCIIVYQDKKRGKHPRIIVTPKHLEHRKHCLNILESIATKFGKVEMTPQAVEMYDEWYMKQDSSPMDDHRIASYQERRTKILVLKVAALMAIGDERTKIENIDLERAIHILGEAEKNLEMAYVSAGTNSYAQHIQHITLMLESTGGSMKVADVVRAVYTEVDADTFRKILETMESMGRIQKVIKGRDHYIELVK